MTKALLESACLVNEVKTAFLVFQVAKDRKETKALMLYLVFLVLMVLKETAATMESQADLGRRETVDYLGLSVQREIEDCLEHQARLDLLVVLVS